ncbi:MAG: ATPase [Pleurocapsa sp. SU_196_0]|nr:ATPase [Pleurocapsa sp. SU_196_0]
MREAGLTFSLLPDRREVTDAVIFAGESITDRETRFSRTAAFRDANPGGMAQALERLSLHPASYPEPVLFDGLRGLNEVRHAALAFPKARFVTLDAPDTVRVQRLLGRGDAFDRVGSHRSQVTGQEQPRTSSLEPRDSQRLEALQSVEGIEGVFSRDEIVGLSQLEEDLGEVVGKVRIVVTERRHYDPRAANAFLRTLNGNRVLSVDTTLESPDDVAGRILKWWHA